MEASLIEAVTMLTVFGIVIGFALVVFITIPVTIWVIRQISDFYNSRTYRD